VTKNPRSGTTRFTSTPSSSTGRPTGAAVTSFSVRRGVVDRHASLDDACTSGDSRVISNAPLSSPPVTRVATSTGCVAQRPGLVVGGEPLPFTIEFAAPVGLHRARDCDAIVRSNERGQCGGHVYENCAVEVGSERNVENDTGKAGTGGTTMPSCADRRHAERQHPTRAGILAAAASTRRTGTHEREQRCDTYR